MQTFNVRLLTRLAVVPRCVLPTVNTAHRSNLAPPPPRRLSFRQKFNRSGFFSFVSNSSLPPPGGETEPSHLTSTLPPPSLLVPLNEFYLIAAPPRWQIIKASDCDLLTLITFRLKQISEFISCRMDSNGMWLVPTISSDAARMKRQRRNKQIPQAALLITRLVIDSFCCHIFVIFQWNWMNWFF